MCLTSSGHENVAGNSHLEANDGWNVQMESQNFQIMSRDPSGTLSGVCVEGRERIGITSPSMLQTKFALCFTFWAS